MCIFTIMQNRPKIRGWNLYPHLRNDRSMINGLILPGPILLLTKPTGKVVKTPEGACSRGCFDNISQGFLSDNDMGIGRINPDYNISQF